MDNNYFNSNNKKDCNGCGVCALKCPKKAITMEKDQEGFLYPKIDKSKCVNCGLCKKYVQMFTMKIKIIYQKHTFLIMKIQMIKKEVLLVECFM